jgi:hypothetical protein
MIPSDVGAGVWNVYLAIADAADTLRNIPQYNILAINQDSSMQNSGLNNLSRSIIITSSSPTTTSTEGGISTATDSQSTISLSLPLLNLKFIQLTQPWGLKPSTFNSHQSRRWYCSPIAY